MAVTSRKRVELFVSGRNFRSLADQRAAAFFQNAAEVGERQIDVEPGNGFELVERAARVAEAAPADHRDVDGLLSERHDDVRGRNYRSDHERSFVADAARGMLIDFRAGQTDKSRTSPECSIASVSAASSQRSSCRATQQPSGKRQVDSQERELSVAPRTRKSISSRDSSAASRFLRMMSTARMRGSRAS